MTTHNRVLVLVSHPNLEDSRINDALATAAGSVDGVTVRHIDSALRDNNGHFDVQAEQAIVDAHDVLVFQFPWYWYSAPAVVKQYLDEILTRGWAYVGGSALEGKPVIFAITTGGIADAYRADGQNKFTMNELLAPYIATANMTKMVWNEPFVVHGVRSLSDQELSDAALAYQELLTTFAG